MAYKTEWMRDYLAKGGDPSQIDIKSQNVGQKLNAYIGRKNISVSALAGLAVVSRANLYKIMNGTVTGTRNTVLRIAMALELTFDETQELLKTSGNAMLTVRSVRDRYISQAIIKKSSMDDLEKMLLTLDLNSIYGKND